MPEQIKSARWKAWKRQRGLCYYCRSFVAWGEATVDHKKPKSMGGTLRNGNAVMACRPCNEAKKNMPASVFILGHDERTQWSEARREMWRRANRLSAIAAGSREGGDVKQAPCEASQSGGESRIAQPPSEQS